MLDYTNYSPTRADTYVSSNGSRAIVANTHDADQLISIGWTLERVSHETSADTMARQFGL